MHGRVSSGTEIFIGGLMTVNLTATSSQFDIEIIWVSFWVFCPQESATSKWNDLTKRCLDCKRSDWCLCFRLNRNRLRKWGLAYYEPVRVITMLQTERERECRSRKWKNSGFELKSIIRGRKRCNQTKSFQLMDSPRVENVVSQDNPPLLPVLPVAVAGPALWGDWWGGRSAVPSVWPPRRLVGSHSHLRQRLVGCGCRPLLRRAGSRLAAR